MSHSVVDRDRVEVATREIFWVAAESGRDPTLFFWSRPSWVATLGRDRVDPKKYIFFKNREYMIKTHKELNRLKVSVIDTEIFDLMPNIRDNRPNI